MMSDTTKATETLYSETADASRGEVQVKEKGGKLYALIGSRWCRVERRNGKLYEIWVR